MKKQKVIHIKGLLKPRLCGAIGDYASVGDDSDAPICEDCIAIYMTLNGEAYE
jgi:NifU-like protein involved in Fe-S cluster formation